MQKYKLLQFFSARLQQMSFLISFESLSVFFEQNLSCAKNTKACQFQVHSLCVIAVWAAVTNATDRWFLNSKSVFLPVLQTETSEQQASLMDSIEGCVPGHKQLPSVLEWCRQGSKLLISLYKNFYPIHKNSTHLT